MDNPEEFNNPKSGAKMAAHFRAIRTTQVPHGKITINFCESWLKTLDICTTCVLPLNELTKKCSQCEMNKKSADPANTSARDARRQIARSQKEEDRLANEGDIAYD